MKEIVMKYLHEAIKKLGLNIAPEVLFSRIEIPPSEDLGDFAFPCFFLAKELKNNPIEIAKNIIELNKKPKEIEKIEIRAGYLNFFVDKQMLIKQIIKKVSNKNFGKIKGHKKIGIEYPSPNTNKALHIGHLRNMAIGNSISRIVEFAGNKVFHLNLFNDRGILISKSMIGYEKYAKGKTPLTENIKPDKFVGELYVKFSKESAENPELEKEAQQKLILWEKKDLPTIKLWKMLNKWAYLGMNETFKKFGLFKIDKNYYESEIYESGKEIVEKGLKKEIFQKKEDGAIFIDLNKENLGEKILLRSDGTSVYITQDLFLAEQKIKDFELDSSYYVVGSDQEYHFRVLFEILNKLGIKKDWRHLSYGMVSLPSGKMKSREGTAISADDLIDETQKIAKAGLIKRATENYSEKEIEKKSLTIALAAIKYSLLKVDIHKGIVFNPEEELAFEGNTGPYLLYSYARANSILKKIKNNFSKKISSVQKEELNLLKKLYQFEEIILNSYKELSPSLIANYAFELSQTFNEFYHSCPVINSENEFFRLKLTNLFKKILGNSLYLLGIDILEQM